MSGFRTSRTRRVRLVSAAAGVVIAALSMTACKDGTGVAVTGAPVPASSSDTPSASAPASGAGSASGGAGASGASTSTGGSSGGSSAGSSAGKGSSVSAGTSGGTAASGSAGGSSAGKSTGKAASPVTCEGSNTKTVASPVNRPVNHMLLTVTNTGSKPCFLYYYPAVAFAGAQSAPPVIEDSQPQAVVTLEPGQSGYAGVTLSATDGSASGGRTVKSLDVYFYGRDLDGGSVGTGARPKLPAGGVYIDDSLKVTYWQQDMDDALMW
ncbi:DUF4232 domain-containing protein [Streptomyces niveiscabiei]|uniref:DUF4232 domain-containing protein n=1 Tax=Streptomyces niveiscabiei TaxID=164115 RepID=UPI0029A74E2A|nr:DUF4232 domain-containing protein [Streptomyces niveiscabiei]MDX3387591.1 DUF4232 domain-containing protein [Streptomyces niveiscabiei]